MNPSVSNILHFPFLCCFPNCNATNSSKQLQRSGMINRKLSLIFIGWKISMKSLPLNNRDNNSLNSKPLAHLLFGNFKILYPWLTVVHLYKVYRPGLSFCFQLYLIIWKMWTRSLLGVGLLLGAFLFDESQVINSEIWPLPVPRGAVASAQRSHCQGSDER